MGCQKKSEQKKKVPRRRRLDDHQFCTWSNYTLSCRSFCLSLPLSTSKNVFLCFPRLQSIQNTFWENNFRKKVFWKKKKSKKLFIFFFFDFFFFELFFFRIIFFSNLFFFDFFFFVQNLLNTFFFLFDCNSLCSISTF